MAVTEGLKDYVRDTPGSNTPAGSTTIGQDLDDHLRSIKSNVKAAADRELTAKDAAYTITTDDINTSIDVDASATGSILITLPDPSTYGSGVQVGVSRAIEADGTVTTGNINVKTAAGKIDNTATASLATSHVGLMFVSDGTNWRARSSMAFPALSGMTAGDAIVASDAGRIKGAGFTLEEVLEAATEAIFYQAAAPTLWTRNDTDDDTILGLTDASPAGGTNNSGSWTLSGYSVDGHALSQAELPAHTHTYTLSTANAAPYSTGSGNTAFGVDAGGTATGSIGGNSTHTHGLTNDASWRPPIAWCIRCAKDAAVPL